MESLYHKLIRYRDDNYYPMHMPGHKRNLEMCFMENPYGIDVTEIEGFDNLHQSEEILKEAMERAARVYSSEHTHFLVNGSTAGLLAGVAACTCRGDKVLMARNCHKSIYNAIFLNGLTPVYIYPQIDEKTGILCGILPEKLEQLLISNPDIKLAVITSPTYEGVLSDVETITSLVHSYGIPLMVDEAHGAHFGHSPYFPQSSVKKGADIVIHSVHKTLPSFTQTALLHVNGTRVDYERIKEYLSIYQSSSPSYILMAGIDHCMEILEKESGVVFKKFSHNLNEFYDNMKNLKYLKVYEMSDRLRAYGGYDFDRSKITILTNHSSILGLELYDILLNMYKIQMEMVSKDYVLAITSICDKTEGFERLGNALRCIDKSISGGSRECGSHLENIFLDMVLSSSEAYNRQGEFILFNHSQGRISKEYAYLYPPGIPLIVPGEVISRELILKLQEYKSAGLAVRGMKNRDSIEVVKL